MLKHLVSASAKQQALAKLKRALVVPINLPSTPQAFSFSTATNITHKANPLQGVDRSQFKYSAQIPDFEVAASSARSATVEVTDEMAKKRHPLEYLADHSRRHEDPYVRMNERSMMLLNFPRELQVTEQYVRDLCSAADSEAVIEKVDIREALPGNPQRPHSRRQAYAIVELLDKAMIPSLRRALRKHWIDDHLLKLRLITDRQNEQFNQRTLILSNVPTHMRPEDVVTVFGEFGAITHIEMPTLDSKVQAAMDKKGLSTDHYQKLSQKKQDEEYRFAQNVLRETVDVDQQFDGLMAEQWGEERGKELMKQSQQLNPEYTKFNMLDEERVAGFVRVVTQLQAEGIRVEQTKKTFTQLLNQVEQASASAGTPTLSQEASDHLQLETDKENVQQALKYLLVNQESLDDTQTKFLTLFMNETDPSNQVDPIHKLQRMSISELARSYDALLGILENREQLIKRRLKESLLHYGKEEAILQEARDYRREQESLPNLLKNIFSHNQDAVERYLSVNEQIHNVNEKKFPSAEERFYGWLTDTTTHAEEMNFNPSQLAYAKTSEFDQHRDLNVPLVGESRTTLLLAGLPPSPFNKEHLQNIQKEVERARSELNTPFDQIYHKERKLVQDVIKIEKQLRALEERLPNPAEHRKVDPSVLEEDEQFGNLHEHLEPQFIRDKRAEQRLKSRVSDGVSHDPDALNHAYKQLEQDAVEAMIRSGQINRQEYELAKAMRKNNNQINLGYALVTFSHADEARKMLLQTGPEIFIDSKKVGVMEKGRLDHSELDSSYFVRKMKNEGRLVEKKAELREARKNLREYERNIEEEMPSIQRLKEFKSIAQEMIENPKGKTRRHSSNRRTQREQEELYEKIKAFQAKHPGVDVSMLFESEQAERVKLIQHKKAFENYKNYEFLKAGINKETKPAKKRSVYEPFNYPPLEDSVASVLIDGSQPMIAQQGDNSIQNSSTMRRRGRRFSAYTEEEFLEAYLGKDFARRVDIYADEGNHTFGIHGRLSEIMPDRKDLLKYPKVLEEKERLKKYMGWNRVDGEPIDPAMNELREHGSTAELYKEHLQDTPHATEEGRTRLGDYLKMLEQHRQKLVKQDTHLYESGDMHRIHRRLERDYPNPYKGLTNQEEIEQKEIQVKQQEVQRLEQAAQQQLAELSKGGRGTQSTSGDGFEAESMFYPMSEGDGNSGPPKTKKKGGSGTQKQVRQKAGQKDEHQDRNSGLHPFEEIGEMQLDELGGTNFGSDLRKRDANESVYNLRHAMKRGDFSAHLGDETVLRRQRELMTRWRREQFSKVKAEQMGLPEDQRVPHYIDKQGVLRPYRQEVLDSKRQEQFDQMHSERLQEITALKKTGQWEKLSSIQRAELEKLPQSASDISNWDLDVENVLKREAGDVITECLNEELLDAFKDYVEFDGRVGPKHTELFNYQHTQMDETDLAKHEFRQTEATGRSLSDFVEEAPDVYAEMKKGIVGPTSELQSLSQQQQEEKEREEALSKLYQEANANLFQTPTLESYFRKQAKGQSVYEPEDPEAEERREHQLEQERIQEDAEDEHNYRRELLARMFGGSLTARQFGVLRGLSEDQPTLASLQKLQDFKNTVKAKDDIRVLEEMVEAHRRTQVKTGEWTEEESYFKLNEYLQEMHLKYPTERKIAIEKEEMMKQYQNMLAARDSNTLPTREYYFDEGLGESLTDHIDSLKKKFEGVSVSTRRDKDGFAIVTVKMDRQFKYKLEDLENLDPEMLQQIQKDNKEVLLRDFSGESSKDMLKMLTSTDQSYVTQNQKKQLDSLMRQRYFGNLKSDKEGFAEQLKLILSNQADDSEPALFGSPANSTPFTPEGHQAAQNLAYSELMVDMNQIQEELQFQLMLKVNHKLNSQKLEKKDLVSPVRSETTMFRNQVENLEDSLKIIYRENKDLAKAGEEEDPNLDIARYREFKAEIKRRRETKERILEQGFPELKAYRRM